MLAFEYFLWLLLSKQGVVTEEEGAGNKRKHTRADIVYAVSAHLCDNTDVLKGACPAVVLVPRSFISELIIIVSCLLDKVSG